MKAVKQEGFWDDKNKPKPGKKTWDGQREFLKALDVVEGKAKSVHYKGASPCRVCKERNGSGEFSYKGWKWPSGFRHYIEKHNCKPTPEFMDFIMTHGSVKKRKVEFAPELSREARKLLVDFGQAAMRHGWEQDQGYGQAVVSAAREFTETQHALAEYIQALETGKPVQHHKPLKKTSPVWHLKVVSSNIKEAAYNFQKHTLMVQFKSGKRYVYSDVSKKEFETFSTADSQGRWFIDNIKDKKPCKQLKK